MQFVRAVHLSHGKYSTGGEIAHFLLNGEGKKMPFKKNTNNTQVPIDQQGNDLVPEDRHY